MEASDDSRNAASQASQPNAEHASEVDDRQRPSGRPGPTNSRHSGPKQAKSGWPKRGQNPKRRGDGNLRHHSENSRDTKRRKADQNGDPAAPGSVGKEAKPSYMSIPFTAEEIAAEGRKPKRKVAVMIGYAGTGYHGMQINHMDKTIEGDIFAAFVAAGAISKANASDPKKSALVRCARTDKGVHAAGNVISLKMIIEDEDILEKVNDQLPPQIRVWGLQRTNNAFSCYQACDSRWYEYLLPSYSLLPPHKDSFLGRKVQESATRKGTYDEVMNRLEDVKGFWEEVEERDVKPIMDSLEPDVREEVLRLLHSSDDSTDVMDTDLDGDGASSSRKVSMKDAPADVMAVSEQGASSTENPAVAGDDKPATGADGENKSSGDAETAEKSEDPTPAELAVRRIRAAQVAAKRRYRITPARLQQLQDALNMYKGTNNFYNYTVRKPFRDPSAKRHIKSFIVNPTPVQIRDTEWLSLKVHGQSFMMHQIRKMVAMAVMVVRCGANLDIIRQSYGERRISIPKVPGLGLLLERPVFDSYNQRAQSTFDKPPIDFSMYEKEIQEFKDREIYKRMWDVEEEHSIFHAFFHQLDSFRMDYFLWVTADGLDAAHERTEKGERIPRELEGQLGDEGEDPNEGDG